MKKRIVILAVFSCFMIFSGVFYSCTFSNQDKSGVLVTSLENTEEGNSKGKDYGEENQGEIPEISNNNQDNPSYIYIHICGAVNNPDVYQVKKGVRLADVIRLAGGLLEEAAGDFINQAQTVEDGQRYYIPTKEELKEARQEDYIVFQDNGSNQQSTSNGLVNINRADLNELMKLPGIGQMKAQSIIDYRETIGAFQTIEEIMNIPGIKAGVFSKISSYITVN